MEISINKTFLKELSQIPLNQREKIEQFIFTDASEYKNIQDIPNCVKLKGYNNFYRIRFGNYRAGLKFENNTMTFERIMHRKDIYKYYP